VAHWIARHLAAVTAKFLSYQACRTRLLKLAANSGFASRRGESFVFLCALASVYVYWKVNTKQKVGVEGLQNVARGQAPSPQRSDYSGFLHLRTQPFFLLPQFRGELLPEILGLVHRANLKVIFLRSVQIIYRCQDHRRRSKYCQGSRKGNRV
jgi:hypothetical protein